MGWMAPRFATLAAAGRRGGDIHRDIHIEVAR